jgi:hypothetical protein
MTYLENQEQLTNEYASTSPKYRGDELDNSEKLRIRENISKGRSILDSMSEIEKTAFTLQALENRFGWAKGGLL